MDSLLFLCARRVVAQNPLPALPAGLYPVLFKVAFLEGKPLVLRDLVATWPFPELNFQRLVGHRKLLLDHSCIDFVKAVIQGVVDQLRQEPEPGRHSSLRVLDMTILPDSESCHALTRIGSLYTTDVLAKACVEVSKHQQEFQRCRSKHHKACSGAETATAAPQPLGVDIHTDLFVSRWSYDLLRDALQPGAATPIHVKCHQFHTNDILAAEIVTLLESLDPSCLQRVKLHFSNLGLTGLLVILPHLSRFPELRSLKLHYSKLNVQHLTPESNKSIRSVARQLGMLPALRELSLGFSRLSGNLHQILCDFQTPLESLELPSCFLLPADLAFISQSIHAPALKKLDLSGLNISRGLLEPLRLLLEETSASLLHLDLMRCHMTDSHLEALLPTLLRCSRLRFLGLFGNYLSTAALKDLLQKTLELPDLQLVVHPYPMDCCKPDLPDSGWHLVVDEELLAAATAEISQLLENSGRTELVLTHHFSGYKDLDYFL